MGDLVDEPARAIARRIRDRDVSAVEAVRRHLERIEQVDPLLNAVVVRCDEAAVARAADLDEALVRAGPVGPLHGVPMTIKDAFDISGVVSTGGLESLRANVPPTTATAVQRLLDAGAVLLGRSNSPALTLDYDTHNRLFGRTGNPYDFERSPGGSSGGAAAIVAACGAALELGSDTGGSIRLPAHFCGIAGIKPTWGRVPRTGLVVPGGTPIDPLTHVGPLARYVDDLALVLPILAGEDWQDPSVVPVPLEDPTTVDLRRLRVAYYLDNGTYRASAEVAETVEACAKTLAAVGATVVHAAPPAVERSSELFVRIFATDGNAWQTRVLQGVAPHEDSQPARPPDRDADPQPASAWTELQHDLDQWRRGMLSFIRDHDVILAPVHAHAALPPATLSSPQYYAAFGYAQTYNLTGWPVAVTRAGTSSEGLPIGVQVVARPWRDHVALAVAGLLEAELGGWRPSALLPR